MLSETRRDGAGRDNFIYKFLNLSSNCFSEMLKSNPYINDNKQK